MEAVGIGRRCRQSGRWLLRDVSLQLLPRDRIFVVGPTGSGKTLLLRALALLDPLDAGEIRWLGRTVLGSDVPSFRSRVIYLHQQPGLFEGSVEENLRRPFQLKAHGTRTFSAPDVALRLGQIGRDETFLRKNASSLSGGERQIVALLRAIQLSPQVLLLDEPTAALDEPAERSVEKLVVDWLGERPNERAFVWVTHSTELHRRFASQTVMMRDGHLASEEP